MYGFLGWFSGLSADSSTYSARGHLHRSRGVAVSIRGCWQCMRSRTHAFKTRAKPTHCTLSRTVATRTTNQIRRTLSTGNSCLFTLQSSHPPASCAQLCSCRSWTLDHLPHSFHSLHALSLFLCSALCPLSPPALSARPQGACLFVRATSSFAVASPPRRARASRL